jgi:Raf kinase inhibitor-like YbhB/YbcL family protein
MRTSLFVIALACVAAVPGWTSADGAKPAPGAAQKIAATRKEAPVSLTLTSPAFEPMGGIPKRHTCDGEDLSPPLAWSAVPAGTKSLALVVDDPDAPDPAAPKRVWVHWILYGLPPGTTAIEQGATARTLPPGTREGLNDWKRTGWGGPCPPVGRHRYFHKLYALDIVLPDLHHPDRAALEKAMAGHVIAKAELVGTYQRTR